MVEKRCGTCGEVKEVEVETQTTLADKTPRAKTGIMRVHTYTKASRRMDKVQNQEVM